MTVSSTSSLRDVPRWVPPLPAWWTKRTARPSRRRARAHSCTGVQDSRAGRAAGLPTSAATRRSVATNQADQLALDLDPVRAEHACLVGRVRGLERDRGAAPAEALQGRLLLVDEGDDDVAGVRDVLLADDDEIAFEDAGVDH